MLGILETGEGLIQRMRQNMLYFPQTAFFISSRDNMSLEILLHSGEDDGRQYLYYWTDGLVKDMALQHVCTFVVSDAGSLRKLLQLPSPALFITTNNQHSKQKLTTITHVEISSSPRRLSEGKQQLNKDLKWKGRTKATMTTKGNNRVRSHRHPKIQQSGSSGQKAVGCPWGHVCFQKHIRISWHRLGKYFAMFRRQHKRSKQKKRSHDTLTRLVLLRSCWCDIYLMMIRHLETIVVSPGLEMQMVSSVWNLKKL